MTVFQYLFVLLWAAVTPYALWRGGLVERLVALIFLFGGLLSGWIVARHERWFAQPELGLLLIDTLMLVLLVGIAMRTTRYWAVPMASMQMAIDLAHFADAFGSGIVPRGYYVTATGWSYPMLALLAAGTWFHRLRLARYGWDPDWVWQLPQAYRRGAAAIDVARFIDLDRDRSSPRD